MNRIFLIVACAVAALGVGLASAPAEASGGDLSSQVVVFKGLNDTPVGAGIWPGGVSAVHVWRDGSWLSWYPNAEGLGVNDFTVLRTGVAYLLVGDRPLFTTSVEVRACVATNEARSDVLDSGNDYAADLLGRAFDVLGCESLGWSP